VNAYLLAAEHIDRVAGQVFNLGGGPSNTISLLQLLDWIAEIRGRRPVVEFSEWRTGDQRYYVSDTRRFQAVTGWHADIGAREGVADLHRWLRGYLDERGHRESPLLEALCASGGS
jgi:CDP-paratose 2-epimerase